MKFKLQTNNLVPPKTNIMKHLYLILSLLLFLPTLTKAETNEVTFSASETTDRTSELTLSKKGITLNLTDGAFNLYSESASAPGYYYRLGSASSLTISSTVGNITAVIFTVRPTATYNDIKVNKKSIAYNSTKRQATWTGNQSTIVFNSSSTNNIISISVTYNRAITVSESTYATFWCDKAYTMPSALTGYTISDVANGIEYGETYDGGSTVPANTPLLIHGDAGSYAYTTDDDTSLAPTPNMLVCAMGTTVSNSDTHYYKLSYKSSTDKTVGFYWDSEDGHSITVPYGKAYIAVPLASSSGAKGYTLGDLIDDSANGIVYPTIRNNEPESGEVIYDINGVAHPYSTTLPKGIYIRKGGRKIIVR